MSAQNESGSRQATVRRLYFYLVALASFCAGLGAFASLVTVLDEVWFSAPGEYLVTSAYYARDAIAASAGLLVVAVPLYVIHWGIIQRWQTDPVERQAALRKFFLYTASLVAIGFALFRAYDLLEGLALLAFGEPVATSNIWPSGWFSALAIVAAGTALQLYFHRVLVRDGDYGTEVGWCATWRRLYQTIAGITGLILILWGGAAILETGLRSLIRYDKLTTMGDWWREWLANGLALAILGALIARINWRRWLAITELNPHETRSGLRRFYLYLAVVIGALATLVPLAGILRQALLLLFGAGGGELTALLDDLSSTIAFVPFGLIIWVWHWRYLRAEADRDGESAEGKTVRRLYYYAVAAVGLALLWFGAVEVMSALLDWLVGSNVAGTDPLWVEPLATGLSLLAVGAPVWAIHWRTAQRTARRDDIEGQAERASLPRRIYLYGVALAGALLILFYLAQVVYRLFLMVLGDPNSRLLSLETADNVARSAIAAILWIVHLLAIRTDTRQGAAAPVIEPTVVEVSAAERRAALAARITELEAALEGARAELRSLDDTNPTQP